MGCRTRPRVGRRRQAFVASWLWSVFFRFVVNEPAIIGCTFGLPLCFSSELMANLCGETVGNLLGVAFEAIMAAFARVRV